MYVAVTKHAREQFEKRIRQKIKKKDAIEKIIKRVFHEMFECYSERRLYKERRVVIHRKPECLILTDGKHNFYYVKDHFETRIVTYIRTYEGYKY